MNTHPELTREEMIEFLRDHFRYNSMNSWNRSTSYARNVKLHRLDLTREQENRAYEIIQADGAYDKINGIIRDFGVTNDYRYQIGFNGRSGGYLVLYRGGKNDPGELLNGKKLNELKPSGSAAGTLRMMLETKGMTTKENKKGVRA